MTPTTTQTRRKVTIEDVARFAHVSVRDVADAVKDPDSVTSRTLAVIREAAQEVGFDITTGQRQRAGRGPRDPHTTRSGLRKIDPRPLVAQGREQARAELAALIAAAPERPRGNDSEFYRSAAAKQAWVALLEKASRMVDGADEEVERLRPQRDRAMLSLFFYGRKRGVDQAAGLSPTTWYDMREKALGVDNMGGLKADDRERIARERDIEEVPDAEQVIADVAPKMLVLNGYREAAFAEQKRAALYLHGQLGVSEPEIRDVTRRSEDSFWQWRHQESEKRKRKAGAAA